MSHKFVLLPLGLCFVFCFSQVSRGDLLTLDDYSVSTGLLSVSGGGEDFEATENFGGPLNGLGSRGLILNSFASSATAQITGGQVNVSAVDDDCVVRVVYEFDLGFNLSVLGDGLFVDVGSNSADVNLGMFIASLDGNDDPVFAYAGTIITSPGIFSFDFSSFVDEFPGNPVNQSEIRAIGFDLAPVSSSPSSISISSFGISSIPEPASSVALMTLVFMTAMRRRQSA